MGYRACLWASLVIGLSLPGLASADSPCATDSRARPIGPLQVGELDGFLAVPHRACPREEIALGGDALLVADSDNFFGNIHANGRGRFSGYLGDPNVEAFVSWEFLRYQTLVSAVSSSYLGLGYLSFGVSGQVFEGQGMAFAVTGRMVLPTTTGLDENSQPLAMDVGLTGAYRLDTNFRLHFWLTLLGSLGVGAGPADPAAGLRVGGGVDWHPAEWFALVVEVQSGFFYRDTLDELAVNAGLRFALGTEVGLEIGGSLPISGDRAFDDGALPIAASLMLSWHLR